MSNMKCPFCNGELVGTIGHPICRNQNCVMYDDPMPQDLLEELIRTRKVLDVAVDVLKEINELLSSNKFDVKEVPLLNITKTKISMLLKCINIEQITALEQKDVK